MNQTSRTDTSRRRIRKVLRLAALLALPMMATSALAVDGTWDQDADGNWQTGVTAPWLGGTIADGINANANFTYDLTADRTVTLVGDRAVGYLTFDDTGGDPDNNWTIDGASTLTMNLSSTTDIPTITGDPGNTATIDVVLAGSDGMRFNGNGSTIRLTQTNTFITTNTQSVFINADVVVEAMVLANFNVNSSIGRANSTSGTRLVLNRGILRYIGTGDSTDRLFQTTSNGGTVESSGSGALVFTSTGTLIASNTGGPRTFTLGGTNTDNNTFNPAITDPVNASYGPMNFTKAGASKWIVTNTNDYTGITTLEGGILSIPELTNGGVDGPLGGAGAGAANLVFDGGVLQYTGSGHSTNRNFTVTTNGGGLDASGTGAATFSGNMTASGSSGSQTFTLGGTSTDANTLSGNITDGTGTNVTNLTKLDAGQWILSGSNTYSGSTLVNDGTLALVTATTSNIASSELIQIDATGTLDVTGVTGLGGFALASGQTLAGTGSVNGDLTVAALSTISPGTSPGILSQTGTQTWLTNGNYNWQLFDALGTAGTGFDQIAIDGSLDLTSAANFKFNVWSLSSLGPDTNGPAINFNPSTGQSWTVVTTTDGVIGLPDNITLNLAAFNGTSGFDNGYYGIFSLSVEGNDLLLNYTVPEPAALSMLTLGVCSLLIRRRTV